MATSIFLAKLIGPVALIMGLVALLDPNRVRTMAREALQGEAFLFMSGILALPVGLALVNTHNVWVADWRVVITLLGWMALFSGIARLGFGSQVKAVGAKMVDNRVALAVPGALLALFGAWLSFIAYLS